MLQFGPLGSGPCCLSWNSGLFVYLLLKLFCSGYFFLFLFGTSLDLSFFISDTELVLVITVLHLLRLVQRSKIMLVESQILKIISIPSPLPNGIVQWCQERKLTPNVSLF